MEGLRRSMERGAIAADREGDSGWRQAVIAGLGALVLLIAGWVWQDAQQAKNDTATTIRQFGERLATQEEATRGVRESLIRIENGVNELRRDRK